MQLPARHQAFIDLIIAAVQADPKYLAVLGAGSLVHGGFDIWSDLDFVVVVEDIHYDPALADRRRLAESLGELVSAFTGEHVGEPRLLICLYGPELLHVDIKIVSAHDFGPGVERPVVLWARDVSAVETKLDASPIAWPNRPAQWFEDRVWVWLHYGATKLQRGELFEALGILAFLREQILGPLLHRRAGSPQRGVRRVDAMATSLLPTLASTDRHSLRAAYRATTLLYLKLRNDDMPARLAPFMPDALEAFLGADPA